MVVVTTDIQEQELVDVPVGQPLDGAQGIADRLMHFEPLAADQQTILEQETRDESRVRNSQTSVPEQLPDRNACSS